MKDAKCWHGAIVADDVVVTVGAGESGSLRGELVDLAVAVELHEAAVWAAVFDAARALPGNPLGAVVDRSHSVPLPTLTALDSDEINRVVGLGVGAPAPPETVGAVVDFYRAHGRTRLRVEVSPVARPQGLTATLQDLGLRRDESAITKMVRSTRDVKPAPRHSAVRRLGVAHRDDIGRINAAAWGDWAHDSVSSTWFGATVGAAGFSHYGIFEGDALVSTGALAVVGDLAWVGFAATHPRFRGRNYRQAINQVRMADARAFGCEWVHVEIDRRYSASAKLPFDRLYDRESWTLPR